MKDLFGLDLFGNPATPTPNCKLAGDFIVPPFSVLNAREGAWQDRKRAWVSMGIKSEVGRGDNTIGLSGACESYRQGHTGYAKSFNIDGWLMKDGQESRGNDKGTSIFDPVLTELCYRWFVPQGGQILDPFAGGSVRGIVAAVLGYRYWGCDLRQEQIDANREQAAAICPDGGPEWMCGDSLETLPTAPEADFIFSCPPYGDLERYSDDPRDLSTMEYHTFMAAYKRVIMRACARLKQNRFACFVVGDFRDGKGNYKNFVGDTIAAFLKQGLQLYNEAILLTAVGSLPIRVGKQFTVSRKLGKTHQNVLVFVKGDGRKAADACGPLAKEFELY